MPDPIPVPPLVAATVRAALAERDRRNGCPGMTRTAALTAAELAGSTVTTSDVALRVAEWHAAHPAETTPDGRSTLLGGMWGGRPGRDWATQVASTAWTDPEDTPRPAADGARRAAASTGGAMIALYPDDPAALAVPGGDPTGDLHVTLAFLAEDATTLSEEAVQAATEAADAAAAVRPDPLTLTVAGYGQLGSADPPATVLILQATDDSRTGAAALAEAARTVLDDFGSEAWPPEHDSFVPHLTLGYGIPLEAAAPFVGRDLTFSTGVALVMASERIIRPWGAAPPARAAAVEDPLPILRGNPGDDRRGNRNEARLQRLSKKLRRIDTRTRAKLHAGAEVALADGLRRAGVKVTQRAAKRSRDVQTAVTAAAGVFPPALLAAVGITEQEALAYAFGAYGTEAERWLTDADRQRVQALRVELGLDDDQADEIAARFEEKRSGAVAFLVAGLGAIATRMLTDPHPHVDTPGEVSSSGVPLSIVTQAMAIADGKPTVGPGVDGPGALAEGEVQVDRFGQGITFEVVAGELGDVVEQLTWVWGGSPVAFEPHMRLDGSTTTSDAMEDDWANNEDFPSDPYFYPGDHTGCSCWVDSEFALPLEADTAEPAMAASLDQ